ncbi:MAG TPA: S-methyl-5-thioribose-1-phosphate isomerase [Phycisphaerae bacterium]|nr:S-methyl-5-thioribose-1-phosphate isomerase [Phycisphaerae bacterium]HNU46096.1 S-methyl-5-thioribose-1-phosphate isomerase [Phycisphaerae bacterium]
MTTATLQNLPRTIEWVGDLSGHVALIDQTLLPEHLAIVQCHDVQTLWQAIRRLQVRGAPALGIAAAMGVVLGVRSSRAATVEELRADIDGVCAYLGGARPTAVNLFWALDRMRAWGAAWGRAAVDGLKLSLLEEARRIRDEDAATCRAIGCAGAHLIRDGTGVLTHCNAGWLATAEFGTALALMYTAHEAGRRFHVYADETRPLLQGSRLTAWELSRAGIDVTVVCDNMAGLLMRQGKIDLVVTGADRIAANGDVANKVGTYSVAVLAEAHRIPFYVAAPSSTFDSQTPSGDRIPIEERDAEEVRRGFGRLTVPADVPCFNPAFDVTPARLIRGIVTERGMIEPVQRDRIDAVLGKEPGGRGHHTLRRE